VNKISVLFIDKDENYLMALEKKFVEEIGGYVNISIITDMYYFGEFFSTPKEIDVLVINEQIYDVSIKQNHKIGQIYLLTENPINNNEDELYNIVYKYTSVNDIFMQISGNEKIKQCLAYDKGSKKGIITVCSPGGGTGKTTLAIATALSLARAGKRVIYVSRDYLQAFGYFFDNKEYIDEELKKQIQQEDVVSEESLKKCIRNNLIDYVLPFENCLQGTNDVFTAMLEGIKQLNIHDYIIIDTDKVDSDGLMASVDSSDKIMVVTTQEKVASDKLKKFAEQIKNVDKSKIIYVCNKYVAERDNELLSYINSFYIRDYIYYDEAFIDAKVDKIINNTEVTKLANLFL